MEATSRSPKRFSFDSAAVWLLALAAPVAAVFLIPTGAVPFIATKVSILAFAAIIAFIAFVVARLVRGTIIVPPLVLLGTVWLLPVAYGLSALFSGINPAQAFFGIEFESDTLGFVLLLALLTTLTALSFRLPAHFKRAFIVSGVALGVLAVAQIAFIVLSRFGVPVSPTGNLIGTFSDLGMALGLGVVTSLLALRFLTLSRRISIALIVGIFVSLALLVLVNVQIIWFIIALVSGGLFIEVMMHRRAIVDDMELEGVATLSTEVEEPYVGGEEGRSMVVPLVTLVLSLFFIIGGSTIAGSIVNALGASSLDVSPSWQSTFTIGSHTYASSPLFGSGPGTFGAEWLKFRDRSLNETVFWNVDFVNGIGYIPTSFVTTGVVGVIAWLVFLGFFIYTGLRAFLFRLPSDTFMRFASLASFTGAAYVFLLAFFGRPGPVVLAFGFVALGLFISSLRAGKVRQEWGIVFSRSPRVGFVIVFVLTLLMLASVAASYVVALRYMSSLAYAEASQALSVGDIDRAQQATVRSITFAPTGRSYRLASAIGIERMRQIVNNTTLGQTALQEQFQQTLSASVAAAQEATRLDADDYQNWIALGNVYQSVVAFNIDGAYESAKAAYEQARALNPTNPIIPYIVAQLELAKGNGTAAETELLASWNLKRDYVPAILLLSQLEIQLGKAPEALQAAETAAYLAPNDAAVLLQVGLLRSGTGDFAGAIAALSRALEINPQYANARFFLGALYANSGALDKALTELTTVSSMSAENATAVAADIAEIKAGRNPFPAARLRSLGVPQPPVKEPGTPTP